MPQDDLIIKHKSKMHGEDGYKTFSVRIKEATVARIDEVSIKTDRSRNELIGTFLEYALDHCKVDEEVCT